MSTVAHPVRRCTRCRKKKPLSDFTKQSAKKDGRSAWCKLCTNDYARKSYAQKQPTVRRSIRLRRRYGITLDDYDRMLAEQQGRCASCGSTASLCVDHDHSTGHVRALLCHGCNTAIGYMQDDPDRLEKAANYLRNHDTKLRRSA